MEKIDDLIIKNVQAAIADLYATTVDKEVVSVQQTKKEFVGDRTIIVFPLLKLSKKSPEQTANEIGEYLMQTLPALQSYNVIKGFLNLSIHPSFWLSALEQAHYHTNYGHSSPTDLSKKIVIEFSSPNTNKPLHLGHVRNNLIGHSLAEILTAASNKVTKVNLINDRGIHICKSMLAWQKWGNGETPESAALKGDHLVGKYYVLFDVENRKQIAELVAQGHKPEQAAKMTPLILEAQEMLRAWEAHDQAVLNLWTTMNGWVYAGFEETYKRIGIEFDKIYYESQTYKLGKDEVSKGVDSGVLLRKDDGSVWADLTADGLDQKLLLRSDSTSVYMTQDIGTAIARYNEYQFDKHIYVVGNEQDYHFKVLTLILQKLGYQWAGNLLHFSYGMVDLTSGRMKSREGTVVDADDLMAEMYAEAKQISKQLGKLEGFSVAEAEQIFETIALGALKYYILKVDPKKNITFNPEESIDFNGNTGPFIQYTYARIQSVLRKATEKEISHTNPTFNLQLTIDAKEIVLLKYIYNYPEIVSEAANNLSPAMIANYVYDFAKEYNQFYHDFPILKETNDELRIFRLVLSATVAKIIKSAMLLLGIGVPARM